MDYLAQARHIYFLGLGTSAAVAMDAEHKFFRFKVPVTTCTDPLMHRMLAAGGGVGDVFFFISHTGRTEILVETAELARTTEAIVVSLTAEGSPLAEASHLSIGLSVAEYRGVPPNDFAHRATRGAGRLGDGYDFAPG